MFARMAAVSSAFVIWTPRGNARVGRQSTELALDSSIVGPSAVSIDDRTQKVRSILSIYL